MTMDKAEFLRIMALPQAEREASGRFDWVGLLAELKTREQPFNKDDVAKEYGAKRKYIYNHLREWVEEDELKVIKTGAGNVYLATCQIPEDE